MYKTGLWLE